ncbi:unnamed protein product, partial [Aphanomyces euteiches]
WEIIMNYRPNRIVVLTTHFMDEADILGDRIATWLKANCVAVAHFVQHHIGDDVKVLSNVGTEISFQLPLDCSHLFAKMFAELDDKLDELGVLSYGISVTTLEEVFIKVAEIGDEFHQHTQQKTDSMANAGGPHHGYRLTDHASQSMVAMFFIHFWALQEACSYRET